MRRFFRWCAVGLLGLILLGGAASPVRPAPVDPSDSATAATSGATAEIVDGPAQVGRAVVVRVRIPGREPAVIDLPELADWTVVPRGRVIDGSDADGGAVSAYRFEFIARRAGLLTVPALTVETGGRTLRTAPLSVRVRPRPAPPAGLAGHDLFLDAAVTTEAPFVGQTVVYTLRLYRAVAAASVSLEPPEFPGFAVTVLPGQRDGEVRAFGKAYVTAAVDYLLTPLHPGRVSLAAPTARVDRVDGGRATVATGPVVVVTPRALPPAPASADAPFTGLVGDMTLAAAVRPDAKDASGRRAVYELRLAGRGNLDAAAPPVLAVPDGLGLRALPTGGAVTPGPAGYRGERIFRYALTARKSGTFRLPAVRLRVFDPVAGAYRTIEAPARLFRVASKTTPVVAPPLHPFDPAAVAGPPSWPWRAGLALLPPALFVLTVVARRRKPDRAAVSGGAGAAAVAEALRRALDGPAGQGSEAASLARALARALAGLDALLYAGGQCPPEDLEAARRQGLAALRRAGK